MSTPRPDEESKLSSLSKLSNRPRSFVSRPYLQLPGLEFVRHKPKMKCLAALFLVAATAQHTLAEFSYTVEATHKGQPVDPSAIKLEPFDPKLNSINETVHPPPPTGPPPRPGKARKNRRALNSSTSANWSGAVVQTTSTDLIHEVHGYFQAPTLSLRSGVTSYPQWVGEWIGIDGYHNGVILQAGLGHTVCTLLL